LDRWEQSEAEFQDSPMKGFDVDGGSMIEAGCRYDDKEWVWKRERIEKVSIIAHLLSLYSLTIIIYYFNSNHRFYR